MNDDNDTDPAGRWAGPVGRGMMTAEQFYLEQNHTHQWTNDFTGTARVGWEFKFAEAYAAAQLAEKEREIPHRERLRKEHYYDAQRLSVADALEREDAAIKRAEAAEERLKEAQALNKRQMEAQLAMAESLREREAELEWWHKLIEDLFRVALPYEGLRSAINELMAKRQPLPSPPKVQP